MIESPSEVYDYIVVGAGAAGAIVAARLAEDPFTRVCLVEAGPSDRRPYVMVPAGFVKTLMQPDITWQFHTEPTPLTGGRPISTTQGKVVGGSGSINGMVYNRGLPSDFGTWAKMGNTGWSWDDLLPYFRKSEFRVGLGTEDIHGRNSRGVPVTDMDWFHPVSEALIEAARSFGLPLNPDYNSGMQEGVGYFQRTIRNGLRVSSAAAILRPVLKRPNLKLITNATVTSLVIAGRQVKGVKLRRKGSGADIRVDARREVVLSAGTVNTARLLQISGIGPGAVLTAIGVPVLHAMPGVGENLADHYSARMVMRAKPGVITLNELSKGPRLLLEMAKWVLSRPNILSQAPSQVYMFTSSSPSLEEPDLQCVFTPGSYKEGKHYMLDDYPGVTGGAWQHRPRSRGFVRARSRDLAVDPVIQPNYLNDPIDRAVMVAGMQFVRRVLHSEALSPFLECETVPGAEIAGDDAMLRFCIEQGSTGYHLVGTAKMGPATDKLSVVDDRLRLHGLNGLRVADASIMPTIPSANTYAASMAIGEKAANMIRSDAR
ncbi:GMC family oxidoreductase N-terminal domain-containing protein [Mesorhizobium sp. M1399]|uniref:GMC family oxidoreductase n=1 Tax=Mesorhizobium sp. M1399 TaxID=2957096 RepID=UPI003335345F